MKRLIPFLASIAISLGAIAQQPASNYEVATNSMAADWYVQLGLDMSLQNPYGHDFLGDVFPNGKTFGVDAAVGRWFTPGFGLRGRVNWENGIGLFRNGHANWLGPFYEPGVNMHKGGYLVVAGDVQFDLHNLLCGYEAGRLWNLQMYPRGGMAYNFGVAKGTPLLGLGVGSTFRINDRCKIYLDVAYNLVSSGFVGVEKSTGIGNNSNGFFDISCGVQINLGRSGFEKSSNGGALWEHADTCGHYQRVRTNGFWHNWYLQFGMDMTLMLPYGYNLKSVMKKGRTEGFDVAVGKWFSPQAGLRVRAKWENGFPLFKNNSLEWVAPFGKPNTNIDHGGCMAAYIDVPLSINAILCGYNPCQKWNVYVFPRAGLISNFAIDSMSPLVGCGGGATYRLNHKWSLYGEIGIQGTTSEFMGGGSNTGMDVSKGFNSHLDFQFGVQLDLGRAPASKFIPVE